ncbi:alanine-zipper protein [Pseudoalteromonas sp. C8]|uniref:alanine-zipper protein n=1 Tax=Pseudoalteromonas sp. C8 TaxID=2686345 RepID=UPI0013FD3F66|nr:alanine-zipper protein [Pseudoalteromonas sp. C8]
MSAIKVNGTWQQVASVKVKRNAVWVDHTAFYSRLEGAWHVIDLNAEAVGPAYHVWKAYADDEQGNGISLLPEGKEYIGFAVGQTTEQPKLADPSIFDWSLIKGTDGEDVDPEVLNEILTKQDDITVAVDDVESRLKAADGGLASALATAEHNFTVSLNKANALIVTTDERITDGVSRIDTAVEGLDATIKSTDTRLTSNIALADSKIASAATAIGNVQNDITGLSSLTGSHGSAITDLETTTDEQAQRVTVLETSDGASKARVTTLEKTSAGHASRLSNVETKSTTAVDKADAAQGSANAANTRVATIANSVTGLEETSEGHASRLTNVETKSTSAVTKADAAQGSANAANTKVATVTSRVTGLEETSTGHASRLTNVETKSTSAVTKADAAQSTADSGVFKADTAQGTANSATAKVSSVTNRVGTLEETSTGHASRLTNVETTSTTAESKADDAQDAADLAQATADSGVLDAGAAQGTANAVNTKVTSVTNRVGTLEETSTGHASRLTNVETTATTATTKAHDAQDTADSGVSKANAAQGTANSGVSKANTAQAKANSVDTKVTTVTNRVGTLEETSTGHASRLTNVETKSTSAVTKADDAQDTADSGVSKANAAQAKANAATTIATAATNRVSTLEETSEGHASRLSTVETTAVTAVTKADDAQDTADSGVGKAAAAQSTANSGVSKANTAQAKANSATTKVTAVTNRVGTLEETSTGHASRLTNVETKATTATTKADDAQDTADSGVSKANAAQAKANSADGKVNTVTNRVTSLEETSEDYATRFTSVETTSESGVSKANVAQSTANSGVSKANAAQVTANSGVSKANAAKGLADEAQDTADSGVSKANAAQGTANSANTKVTSVTNRVGTLEETSTGHASRLSTVETKATTGVSKANAAQSTANSGVSKANTAQSKANTAKKLADDAQDTADSGVGKANAAQSSANTAKNLADDAQDTADSGVSKANAAQNTANAANTKVTAVTNRVSTLESTSSTHASRLSTVETKATTGVSKANTAQSKANTATIKADTAQDAAEAAQGTANTATTNATAVSNRVSTLESTSTTHASRLSTVETKATSGVSKANTAQSTANTGVSNAAKAQAKANSADSKVNAATNRVSTLETSDLDKARRISMVESIAAKSSEYTLNSANNVVPDVHSALDSSADSGAANLKAGFRVTGSRDGFSREFFQVNPDRSYEIRVRARQAVNSSDNSNRLYAGVAPYDANKKEVARPSGGAGTYLYAAASPKILPTDGTWREYSAIMTGVGMSSRNFREGTRYVRLMFIASHVGKGSPVVDIEYLEIRDVTEVNAVDSRVSVIETASNANASRIESVNASQGKAVASAKDIARAYTDTQTNVLKAERVIKADANGKVSGVHLLSKGSGVDAGGKLYFQADEIAIVPPNWNGSSELDKSKFPFYFSEDRNYMYLDEAVIRQLSAETIDSGRLAVDGIAILSDDITMPPGAIREHMIDPAFKDGIVRVSPDGVVLGGTQSVTSKGVGFNKKISVPALKSGGSAQKMNFSVSGPNEAGLKDVAFDVTMKLNGAAHNFTVGKATIRLSANINYSTEEGGHRLYRTSFNFSEQVILPAPTKGLEYTYEFTISNITFNPKSVVSYNYADKLFFAVSVSEPTVSSGGFITDVRWKDVKEQPSYLGIDTSGSSSYPRMFPANNPASSNSWVRTTSAGLLPYANNKSNLGTSSWKFKEVHSVNFYENGVSLGSKYLGKTATAANADKLAGKSASSSGAANSIALRNSNGDTTSRLFRSTYQNDSSIHGAIAFRHSTTDNYIRFCSNMAAVRDFVDVYSKSEANGRYLPSSGDAITSGSIVGVMSGKVALAANDGHGNANVAFNHANGRPMMDGNAARIEVNTDSSSNPFMSIELGSGVKQGVTTGLTSVLWLDMSEIKYRGNNIYHTGNTSHFAIKSEADSKYLGKYDTAAKADLLEYDNQVVYGRSGLQASNVSGGGGEGTDNTALENPTNDWWYHITANHANGGGYYFDIACSFHTNRMMFKRVSSGSSGGWQEFFHTDNMGSGSGLDADKLDGLHATSFARIGTTSPTSDYLYVHRDSSNPAFYAVQSGTGDIARFITGSKGLTHHTRGTLINNEGSVVTTGQLIAEASSIGSNQVAGIFKHPTRNANVAIVSKNASKGSFRFEANADEGELRIQTSTAGGAYSIAGGDRGNIAAFRRNGDFIVNGVVDVNGGLRRGAHTFINSGDTWIRTNSDDGIYFSSHGGGLHMIDSEWVRTYGGKALFSSSTNSLQAINTDGGIRFKQQLYSTNPTGEGGIVGYYATLGSSKDQMIWTIGSDWRTHAKHYGLGYHYGSEIDGGNKHQLVLKQNGVIGTYLAMNGHARFNGVVNAKATTGVISRVITYDDFLPSTPPAGLENTITASWIGAGAINARHLQVNSLVNNGGSYTSLKIAPDAVRPIALSRTDSAGKEISPIFYVDTKGNGFFDGKLSKNTVDIESIQDEARRQINPYYVGTVAGGTQSGTDKSLNTGGTYVLPAITVLGGKVNLSWVVSGSTSYHNGSGKQAYSTPNWRIEVFRGTTSNTRIVNRTYTGTSFQHLDNEYGSPSYGRWEGSSSIHIDDQISDNYAASGQRYTIRVTRLSGTSMAILVRSFTGSSPAFKRIEMKYDYTSLYYNAAGLANGNITLADDYDKYEFLAVEGSEDNDDVMGITLIPTYTITADVGKFDDKQFMLSSPLYDKYWRVSLQGKRSLIERGENSLIRRIWGVNIVEKV